MNNHSYLSKHAVSSTRLVSVQKQPLPALARRSMVPLQCAQKPINGLYRTESRFFSHCDELQARVGGAGAFGAVPAGTSAPAVTWKR